MERNWMQASYLESKNLSKKNTPQHGLRKITSPFRQSVTLHHFEGLDLKKSVICLSTDVFLCLEDPPETFKHSSCFASP